MRVDEEEAKNELRQLIRQHLSEELRKLRVSVDEQIQSSQDTIVKRLQSAEAADSGSAARGAKKKQPISS